MDRNELAKIQMLESVKDRLQRDVDGFYYYWNDGNSCLASFQLRIIADELDRLNEDWNNFIRDNTGDAMERRHPISVK